MKYKRYITEKLLESLDDTPVVLLNGPRQSGKSTLVKHIGEKLRGMRYVTLDDYTTLAAAKKDPEGFIRGFKDPVIMDEVQRAPDLFLAIKCLVDENRQPGRFLLTGSANVLLIPYLSESLAGRIEILPLYPLSVSEMSGDRENLIDNLFDTGDFEIASFRTLPEDYESLPEIMIIGGYPEVVDRKNFKRRQAWIQSYLTTILSRDVRDLSAIEGLSQLPDLLKTLSTRSGTLLNYSEISRSSGIASSTLKRYFQILETLFVIHTIPSWSRNRSKRNVKSPKLYMTDTGILCHLLGLNQSGLESDKNQYGKILETFVVNEFLKALSWSETSAFLHHYRTLDGKEVDCVLESSDGRVIGVEVKSSSRVTSKDIQGLHVLKEESGGKFARGVVLYQGKEVVSFGNGIFAVPLIRIGLRACRQLYRS